MKLPTIQPQLMISLALIGLFGKAYFDNPTDEMLKTAVVVAFAAAYGYWLGSSTGSKQNGDVVRRIAEQPSVVATGDQPTINTPAAVAVEPAAPPAGERPPWER